MTESIRENAAIAFYKRHRTLLEWLFWPVTLFSNALLLATSVVMEYQRRGEPLTTWEPFAWEFSSALATLVCIVLVLRFDRSVPLSPPRIGRKILAHLGFSVVFSLLHVLGMVLLRHLAYALAGRSYDFGDWSFELLYEYRKDLMTYVTIIVTVYLYRFLASRLIGEARPIDEGEDQPPGRYSERLLVKKFGKEFLLRCDRIEWVEAAGNYMNLHSGGRIYPIRETMTGLEARLDPNVFVRVHRSYLVNLDQIGEIIPQDSGDALIRMRTGASIRMSRRYRDNLARDR